MNELASAARAVGAERALVSIVIPFYRQGQYLRECVSSALGQSYQPVEVIVVDDGSPEPAADFLQGLEGVKLLRQENRGVSSARNTGLSAAQGDYVVFLDADDVLIPDGIEAGVAMLDQFPRAGMAFGLIAIIDRAGRRIGVKGKPGAPPQEISYEELLRSCEVQCTASAVYRRASLGPEVQFDEGLHYGEDYEFYLRFTRERSIVKHGTMTVNYRQHGESASHRSQRMYASITAVLQRELALVEGDPRLRRAAKAGITRVENWLLPTILLDELKAHLAAGEYFRALRIGIRLSIRFPRFFVENAGRKAKLSLRTKVSGLSSERQAGSGPGDPG